MPNRNIKRIAFLQEYFNRPWTIKELIPEVASKGYTAAAFAVNIMNEDQEDYFEGLAKEAERVGIEVMAFTGFMKYQEAYLKEHPEQGVVLNTQATAIDQDGLVAKWGCPFNAVFQKRYFDFLQRIGKIPNLTEVWINDEAQLGHGLGKIGCYCPTCKKAWGEEFDCEMPLPPFEDPKLRYDFITWRFRRWNDVHAKMKEVLNIDHPIKAIFQGGPNPCFEINPWISGIDHAGMVEAIDGIMTNPYYTFHLASTDRGFLPREVYLGECCRSMHGMAGPGKISQICAQGFSHPTFTRPLDERDGLWVGTIPPALGIDGITAYTYLLQKSSPMISTYEKSFEFDKYFAQTTPLKFAALVDSLETQCFDKDAAYPVWRQTYMRHVSNALRDFGIPYAYLPSRRLNEQTLSQYPVVILSGVSCLSSDMRDELRKYVKSGGLLVALGDVASRDQQGNLIDDSFLKDLFGVSLKSTEEQPSEFVAESENDVFANLPWPDEITGQFYEGILYPKLWFDNAVQVCADADTEVLAKLKNEAFSDSPAVCSKQTDQGTCIYFAGIPRRNCIHPGFPKPTLNFAPEVLSRMILQLAGEKLPVKVKNFPPEVPMKLNRPLDQRFITTYEFIPCIGENLMLAVLASYFKEPAELQISMSISAGKKCVELRELVSGKKLTEFRQQGNTMEVDINFCFDDALKIVALFMK